MDDLCKFCSHSTFHGHEQMALYSPVSTVSVCGRIVIHRTMTLVEMEAVVKEQVAIVVRHYNVRSSNLETTVSGKGH